MDLLFYTIAGGVIGTVALPLVGFTAGGVAMGSLAAACQSTIGNVVAGSAFAALQSIGATGSATLIGSAVGGATALLT